MTSLDAYLPICTSSFFGLRGLNDLFFCSCPSVNEGLIMPRTLPWQRVPTEPVKKEETPRKRVKTESELDRDTTPRNPLGSPAKRNFFRSSQSPPTSPAKQCPPEEFLIPGLHRDDRWVMVEDEFYAVAQTYTQHLHYAEYVRRRKEVKENHGIPAEDIERPTDDRTPLPQRVETQRELNTLRERQTSGLAHLVEERSNEVEGDDDELWVGTHLHGFMSSPRKSRSLAGHQIPKSSTRAAAGFGQLPVARARVNSIGSFTSEKKRADVETIDLDEETASGSDDDLDNRGPARMAPPPKRAQSVMQSGGTPRARYQSELQVTPTPKVKSSPSNARSSQTPGFKSKIQSLFDDLDDLPETPQTNNRFHAEENTKTLRPETCKRNSLDPKKPGHSEVPIFLG
ncbi:unnamed protein product [Penicillium salamii]|uniref:Uncharacterized protein n=1 Tax=Penicillium salamii TaxID=1612424 RepID=A0A9W4NAN6_9EURO|nr:unnamed protein product [Penicillium salamii]CAG8047133.1 unnamed protein product [Penicillium salamii]CAG8337970.1 unnamed protein product [Penicillium salamii]CAG8337980.1 unnamed protein product [Penicillium salamii]CAG8346376.1 unnamed protein product [Penicillium salamii]